MDKAAVSRASSHGVELTVKTDYRFPSGRNGESLPHYTVTKGCDVRGSEEGRAAALADLSNFLTPAPRSAIEAWLAELSVISVSRQREAFEGELVVSAYASRLAEYPADVVRYALLKHAWKFWPSWDELRTVCDSKAGPRRHMVNALSKPAPEPQQDLRPPTDDEKARIADLVAEMFPHKSPEDQARAVDETTKGDCFDAKSVN